MKSDSEYSQAPAKKHGVRKSVFTSVIGQILEWYDFFLYGTAAALVFGKVFFPVGEDPLTGTIAAFGGFAVGFIARPFGGVLCGHIGDRLGRKFTMTLTLGAMGVSTFFMGLIPSYADIGIAAPILLVLLRLVQGLAAGGEWSGSILIISENAPQHRRGFLSAFSPCGAVVGFVLSTGAFMLMQHISGDAFLEWGWRVPFLASVVLIALGLYLRTNMSESEEFAEATREKKAEKAPLIEVLRRHPKEVLMVFGLRLGEGAASWIFFAFSIAYGKFLGLSDTFVLGALTCSMVAMIPVTLLAGHLTDLFGRKPVYVAASLSIVLLAYPFFLLLDTKDPVLVATAFVLANSLVIGLLEGAQPALISELLPARLRYSGIGIGREVASVLGGGLAPVIATALLATYRSGLPIAIYLGAMGAITLIAALLTPETYPAEERRRDRQLRRPVAREATVLHT
jgi:MFS family permease